MKFIFTSESVTEGHPDKIADQVSDAVLDAVLKDDPNGRVACETLVTTGICVVAGEITTKTYVDVPRLVRGVINYIGYNDAAYGFDCKTCAVVNMIQAQSPDIAMGVDTGGAGDQGLMFGFACRDSEEYEKGSFMPAPIYFSHRILEDLSKARRSGELPDLQPDAKSQVTVRYVNGKAVGATKVVVSTQHRETTGKGKKYNSGMVREMIAAHVTKSLPQGWMPKKAADFFVNPTGNFVVGGPDGDCGLTGRKIIVDTYGGFAPHGGGAFSGKDPTKVDRSAAYITRYLAKNIVAAGLARKCEIQIAYAIGKARPVGTYVETFGTETVDPDRISDAIAEIFDLRPQAIINALQLKRPIYAKTAAHGHFGRQDPDFTWENLDRVDALKSFFNA